MGKSSKSKGGPVSRKDARKVMKQNEKLKKQLHHLQHKVKAAAQPENVQKSSKSSGKESSSTSGNKPKNESLNNTKKKEPEVKSTKVYKDPFIEAEDAEIARLEKLMGISKGQILYAILCVSVLITLLLCRQNVQESCLRET